jgi:signal transduction histidine kinase
MERSTPEEEMLMPRNGEAAARSSVSFGAFLRKLVVVQLLMVLLAAGMSTLPSFTFWSSLIHASAIGFSIHFLSWLFCVMRGSPQMNWKVSVIAIPLGTAIGVMIGSMAEGANPLQVFISHPNQLLFTLTIAVVFGTGISYYFYSRGVIAESQAVMREEALARASHERRLVEANLQLLQAQIEPHFLFNTLSNILSLIRDEPAKAERMLEDLTRYLRASLQRTRSREVTLDDELTLLRAYLGIQQVRMGARLRFSIDVGPDLGGVSVPPLVIQPLAENAIRHGLEPLVEGGELKVLVRRRDDQLEIEISDSGPGMMATAVPGVGLGNVRARLRALYQDSASLTLHPNEPRGLTAKVSIPIADQNKPEPGA